MNIGEYIKKLREKKELSINQLALYSDVSAAHISRIERGLREPSPDILKRLSETLKVPYEKLMTVAGYLDPDTPTPADKITNSLSDDPELADFWDKLKKREDLRIFFKQTKDLSPADIKKVMRIIKAIEDEEADD